MDFSQFFVDTHHPHLCFVGDQGPCRSLMASSHSQVKGRLPMRITVVDVLKCRRFFRPSKLRNYHRFGREISLDESQKFRKKIMIPIRIFVTVRLEVTYLKTGSFPLHKKRQPQQVPVSLYLGQVSAPYCKKIFTRAAFPFFAA